MSILYNLIKSNYYINYHILAIILFSFLYYILAKYRILDNIEYTQFANYGTTLYFTIVTHFTIGYGDIVPTSTILRILVCCQILFAFLLTNLTTNTAHLNNNKYNQDKQDKQNKKNKNNQNNH